MASQPHRRERARPSQAFDDRLWPVVVALLVLAGFGGAGIIAVANFEDPRWWANGWTYLGSLAIVTLLLVGALSRVKRVQRGLQLAAVLSLILHILLFLSLNQYRLMALADDRIAEQQRRPVEEFRAPDYHIRAPEDPVEAFEKPVETPKPEERPTEIDQRAKQQPEDVPLESTPVPVEGQTPDVPQNVVPMREPQEAAPRLAPNNWELSRVDPTEAEPDQPEPVAVPEQPQVAELDAPAPAESELEQQSREAETPAVRPLDEPLARLDTSAGDIARRTIEEVRETPQTPVELARIEPPPTIVPPRTELPAPEAPREAPQAEPQALSSRQSTIAAVPRPVVAGETAPPSSVETGILTPRRTVERPSEANDALSPAPQVARMQRAPQVRAPQVAALPRAQSGVDTPLDAPQPQVQAPTREGKGDDVPREFGTIRDTDERSVATESGGAMPRAFRLSPGAVNRVDAPRGQPAPPSEPGGAVARLEKSSTGTAPTPADRLGAAGDDLEPAAEAPSSASSGEPRPSSAADVAPPSRGRLAANLPVRVPAPVGVGGLSDAMTPDVGTPNRRASEQSDVPQAGPARLLARKAGGPLPIDGRAREPAAAFARRGGLRRNPDAAGAPSAQTEAAIEAGLVFLAQHQRPDGSWTLQFDGDSDVQDPPTTFRAQTAATGMALLAFLGAGYDHYGGTYADVVQRALDFLIENQRASGDLYQPEDEESNRSAWLYSHGIATIALCEAYGMTGDDALAEPAQRAIDFIVLAQDRARGAWRYTPGSGSDTSVSGWQLMALKSGELAGLQVPNETYERVKEWLDRAQTGGSLYVYNPLAPDTPRQGHGRRPSSSMTAVGLLMRLYTGLNRDDAHMVEGAEYLLVRLPENGSARRPLRDTYYWYYATQVMFHMRGKYWRAWNARLHPLLVESQIDSGPLAGSWDPRRPVPDRWGPHAGRLYVTALNLLSLEVYYRHLPLYESTAQ
ncbi:MAG: hypothetical protein DWQ37_08450 [Planctomycetota bacterium]|nr:MAG: hypothetical protein DWQ37_08450 [Planctomycetota bacterium]